MIEKISGYLQALKRRRYPVAINQHTEASIWQDTGQVLYLENTFKLSYTANSGIVNLEKMSTAMLSHTIQQLAELPPSSPLAKVSVGDNDSAFNISVCAVTWQRHNDKLRIKAIPEAALLRSCTSCFSRSQAVFKHQFLLEHDDTLSATNNKLGVFTYEQISIAQFTAQIALANGRVKKSLKSSVSVKSENFDSRFTEHEKQSIETVINESSQSSITGKRLSSETVFSDQ